METFSASLALCEGNSSVTGSPHKGQWRGALMLSLICAWTNSWANYRNAGDVRRHCAHYDVIVMIHVWLSPYWQILFIVFLFRTCVILCFMSILSPYTCFMWNTDLSEKSTIWWCIIHFAPLQWRHNGRASISNYQPHDCLLNRLFRRRSKKTSSAASMAFVPGIHRWPLNSPHKWPVTRKMFPFDDVIMVMRIIQLSTWVLNFVWPTLQRRLTPISPKSIVIH